MQKLLNVLRQADAVVQRFGVLCLVVLELEQEIEGESLMSWRFCSGNHSTAR